jgi:hypothetical protein
MHTEQHKSSWASVSKGKQLPDFLILPAVRPSYVAAQKDGRET